MTFKPARFGTWFGYVKAGCIFYKGESYETAYFMGLDNVRLGRLGLTNDFR